MIHDAMVCEVSSKLRDELEQMTQMLLLDGVGLYETKMTSISDN